MIDYSKNERARQVMGLRLQGRTEGVVIFDQPCELGYHCPVCKYELTDGRNYDERLDWSEYNGFLWCSVCNRDYPSCLCQPDMDKAIETFLDQIESDRTVRHGSRREHA
jgi:hypothetical protein